MNLAQDLFNPLEHFVCALERSSGWKLHVDSENALVLFRDEACRNHAAKEAGSNYNHTHYCDRNDPASNQDPRAAHITVRRNLKNSVETAKELTQWTTHRFRWFEQHRAQRGRQR